MMKSKRIIVLGLAVLLMGGTHYAMAKAGPDNSGGPAAADTAKDESALPESVTADFAAGAAQILKEISEHSEAMENLEHLSDAIGPRVTGSPQLKEANEWTAEIFRKYGLN